MAGDNSALRAAALESLEEIIRKHGPALTRAHLRNVPLDAPTPHLVDRQKGIWNPSWLGATLSVLTTHDHSYDDRELADGIWAYSFRSGGSRGDNVKLQLAHQLGVDIIYFRPAGPHHYEPIFPVRVVESYPDRGEVILVRRDVDKVDWSRGEESETEYLREWTQRVVDSRKHQAGFRNRVMHAYAGRCAMCSFAHLSLIDAAHIDSDKSEYGDPHVNNGLALCRLHHGAFDRHLMTVTPDAVIKVAPRVLTEKDGPLLKHGIQELHGQAIYLPRREFDRPSKERLERRYAMFRAATGQ